ncbi:MAG TPA: hypothetical protein EYP89_00875 [Candidatus Omnitrophica bacterium]|nr:hypothetical protein [Candidatus Omnitrophota bacterium]
MLKSPKVFFLFVFLSLILLKLNAQIIIEAKVDKDKVETGEIFTYTVKIKGEFEDPKIVLPKFKNFKIISQNQTKSYSFKEGRIEVEFDLVYELIASKPGVFKIEEVIVKDKGKRYKSNSIIIQVEGRPLEEKKKILPYIEKGIEI